MHSHRYQITIEGALGRVGRAAFEEFSSFLTTVTRRSSPTSTSLALYSALIRIQSLGLELMELARIPSEAGRHRTAGAAT